MKTTEIAKEANKVITQIFCAVLKNTDREVWKKAMIFIDDKVYELECGDRGSEMFIWKKVRWIMNYKYGKKFIA